MWDRDEFQSPARHMYQRCRQFCNDDETTNNNRDSFDNFIFVRQSGRLRKFHYR